MNYERRHVSRPKSVYAARNSRSTGSLPTQVVGRARTECVRMSSTRATLVVRRLATGGASKTGLAGRWPLRTVWIRRKSEDGHHP